jgi:hypothetical protein
MKLFNKTKKEKTSTKREVPITTSIGNFIKRWAIRLFHTFFLLLIVYVMLVICTSMIPAFMAYIVNGMGFTLTSVSELLFAGCSGLFFTGWIWFFSYKFLSFVAKIYWKNMKKTFPEKVLEKLKS